MPNVKPTRFKEVSFEELASCFEKPIQVAARRLEICTTLLKKICRQHGIQRWPHRKIKCLEKVAYALECALQHTTEPFESGRIMKELEAIKVQRKTILVNPNQRVRISSSLKKRFLSSTALRTYNISFDDLWNNDEQSEDNQEELTSSTEGSPAVQIEDIFCSNPSYNPMQLPLDFTFGELSPSVGEDALFLSDLPPLPALSLEMCI
eukprot:TRINITY_DN4438_c0_g1_i1.p1 TRINITY_DN4438_c0_g1~~TRINITY_DN4438_c0_g1_i1.p1  ORF type:complete len:207 (-),score=19.77 TRINITY_DN4438_c0_g1_i1:72-692(-)